MNQELSYFLNEVDEAAQAWLRDDGIKVVVQKLIEWGSFSPQGLLTFAKNNQLDIDELVDSVTPATIQEMSGHQKIIGAAISTDKMRLLRDQSTANIGMNLTERFQRTQDKVSSLQRQLAVLRGGTEEAGA